jgi:hypothetical protein
MGSRDKYGKECRSFKLYKLDEKKNKLLLKNNKTDIIKFDINKKKGIN